MAETEKIITKRFKFDTEEDYLNFRVGYQFNFHNLKSGKYKTRYFFFRTTNLILSTSIPILSMINESNFFWIKLSIAIVGTIIAINEGLLRLNKYHENWIQFRNIAESLKREEVSFSFKRGEYKNSDDPFGLLVERVESILDNSRNDYLGRMGEADLTDGDKN